MRGSLLHILTSESTSLRCLFPWIISNANDIYIYCLLSVAKVVVASLLPKHLSSLNMTRHIRFSGSTFLVASLFDAISYILQHHISITYQTLESSNKDEKQMQEAGDEVLSKSVSARRAIGFGGFGLEEQDGLKEYEDEVRPKQWPEIVAEFFH